MNNLLRNIKKALPRKFVYCDVGARWGIEEPWGSFRQFIQTISFEPDKEEYDLLQKKKKNSDDIIYPYALSENSQRLPLNLTKNRGCSSLYKPNYKFLKHYSDWDRFDVEDIVMVQTTSLDSLYKKSKISNVDFIKIDVQGAELDILRGAEICLKENILGIEVEVEFHHMYEGQPLFSDVDSFIRGHLKLQLQDLRKTYWKYPEGISVGTTKGQLIFGDALYFRSPHEVLSWCSRFEKDEMSEKLQMACLMGVVYGYLDYSLCLLSQPSIDSYLDKRTIDAWQSLIKQYGRSLKYRGKGAGKISNLMNLLYRICQPMHDGWASTGHHLGARKKYNVFG